MQKNPHRRMPFAPRHAQCAVAGAIDLNLALVSQQQPAGHALGHQNLARQPPAITVVAAVGGICFLTLAVRELPVSIAYPMWTAIGSLGAVFLGFALLGESLSAVKLLSVGLIVAGLVGLR